MIRVVSLIVFLLDYAMKDLSHPNLQNHFVNASVQRFYCIQLFFISSLYV